jgi:hypothetical protein
MNSKTHKYNSFIRCHSGGAIGADTCFEQICNQYKFKTIAYSYKTEYHISVNKYELSEDEFQEGILHVYKANETLKKSRLKPYLKLYARSWFQVKNAKQIFAISTFIQIESNQFVKGGTGVTVQMAIDNKKEVFVFEQDLNYWFYWDYLSKTFVQMEETPKITASDFVGIGARAIYQNGRNAIENLFEVSTKILDQELSEILKFL